MSKRYRKNDGAGILVMSIITLIFSLLLAFGVVACASNGFTDWTFVPWINAEKEMEKPTGNVLTERIALLSSPAVVSEDGYIEQTISATVYPETAVNKEVDWTCYWADSSLTDNVADYLTVTPTADGSNVAVLRCLAPFNNNITVEVCTRQFGLKAYTTVSFVGKPTELEISFSGSCQVVDDVYHLGLSSTVEFEINATNGLNVVGEDYKNYEVTTWAYGELTIGDYVYSYTGVDNYWYWQNEETITLNSILDKFITVECNDGVVTIRTGSKLIDEYYSDYHVADGGRTKVYYDKVKSVSDDLSFGITIKEPKTGLTKVISLVLDNSLVGNVTAKESVEF